MIHICTHFSGSIYHHFQNIEKLTDVTHSPKVCDIKLLKAHIPQTHMGIA